MTARRRTSRALIAAASTLAATVALVELSAAPIDDAFAAFWAAPTTADAATAARLIAKSGVDFDAAVARLRAGRPYRTDVPRGVQRLVRKNGATDFPYSLDVPATYDPKTRYQVRVHLHGGVGRPEPGARGDGSIGALAGVEQIYVLPQAWAGAEWWAAAQDENLPAILDHVKRTYNVDENRVVVSGVSDGGTGAFYVAMRDTTPYASVLPLNGFILVLRNRDLGISGALFPHNLTNKPFFSVNGGRDPLYPAARVEPVMAGFAKGGLTHVYRPQPEAGHNTAWWPTVKDDFEAFVREHPRLPHPPRLTWQTDSTTARNRAHWLVIDRLASRRDGDPLPDINDVVTGTDASFGTRTAGMKITQVIAGSNAQGMGLQPGDAVRAINGRDLPEGLDLEDFLGIYTAGEPLRFTVDRDGAKVELRGNYAPTPMPRVSPLFASRAPGGRVDLVREGNTIRATTRGVAAFTLLLSPDVVDFSRPVTVVADGHGVFDGRVQKSLDTLLTWAARDNDRTMLYGAALPIVLDAK